MIVDKERVWLSIQLFYIALTAWGTGESQILKDQTKLGKRPILQKCWDMIK